METCEMGAILSDHSLIQRMNEDEILDLLRHVRSCPVCLAASREEILGAVWIACETLE